MNGGWAEKRRARRKGKKGEPFVSGRGVRGERVEKKGGKRGKKLRGSQGNMRLKRGVLNSGASHTWGKVIPWSGQIDNGKVQESKKCQN